MRLPSGVVDQYCYFVAVDATDFTTRETGLSSFTVYRSRNGGASAVMTTPTINETDATNMPGVYELLLDEDTTIDSGDDEQEMVFHITHTGMAPVTRSITIFRPKVTAGETLTVASGVGSANATQINSNSNAAARLALTAAQMIPGTVDTASFTPTTTAFEADDITEATADHYNGRIVVWTSGALVGQATSISDYALVGANGRFTVVAMTEAPANNDTFIIV